MKNWFLILLLCSSDLIIAQTKTASIAEDALNALISNNDVVGASAGYAKDSRIVWQDAKGYANLENKTELQPTSKLRTASIAKSMTAVAVMQLVEQGKLNLDEPIDQYFPEFIQHHKTRITTRHLLSHTSGIDVYKNRKEAENTTSYNNLIETYKVFKNRPLRFEPGTQFYYTTYGYVVLGIIIEKVSGLSYGEYMQKNIWDKAEMRNTGIEKPSALPDNYSNLYHRIKQGKLKLAKANDLSNRTPGGGLYSTVEDLLLFGMALLDNHLISLESLTLMTEHHSLEKYNNGYGLGFYLYGEPDVNDIYEHNGAQTGASCQLFIVPSLGIVTTAMSNTSGAGKEISQLAGKLIAVAQKE